MFCQGLELQALPYLGLYDTQGYQIFSTSLKHSSILSCPSQLQQEISRLTSQGIPISEVTIEHNAGFLDDFQDFIDVNLIFQPYVFYDAGFGGSHSCTLHLAVYQDENSFISSHLNNHTSESLPINPTDILKCNHFTCIHPDKGSMCLSPNNGRVKVSTFVPIHVFYTLALVPYKGKIVKGLATKHLLVINKEKFLLLSWVPSLELDTEDFMRNLEILERLGPHPGFYWYLFNVVWRTCGQPKVAKFGEDKWNEIVNEACLNHQSQELAFKVLNTFIQDLRGWFLLCTQTFEETKIESID
jgi:hypothetical protein